MYNICSPCSKQNTSLVKGMCNKGLIHRGVSLVQSEPTPKKGCPMYGYHVQSKPPPLARGSATKGLKHGRVSLEQSQPTPEKGCIIYVYFVPSEPPPLSRGCTTKGLKHRWVSLVQCEPTPERVVKYMATLFKANHHPLQGGVHQRVGFMPRRISLV